VTVKAAKKNSSHKWICWAGIFCPSLGSCPYGNKRELAGKVHGSSRPKRGRTGK
jgi:hypothetical protein